MATDTKIFTNLAGEFLVAAELTLRSLKRLIKQLQEEIIWYESHARVRESSGSAVASISNPGEASSKCTN